jgi:tRNA 2-selenouridine synthase
MFQAVEQESINSFLDENAVLFDVRSPSEYLQGHIPRAINIPLFSDEERAKVGLCYKKESPEAAMNLGLEIVGPKLHFLVQTCKENNPNSLPLKFYCWRGGLRSQSLAQVLAGMGITCSVLQNGYKAFRHHCLETLKNKRQLRILGGMTGTGKTKILHALKKCGEQVLDLEALAKHKGSVFGCNLKTPQPSCEQFENLTASCLHKFSSDQDIWVEDESRLIGSCKIPDALYNTMKEAPLHLIERPFEERYTLLIEDYKGIPIETAKTMTNSLKKRLGPERTKDAIQAIDARDSRLFIQIILGYYDRCYKHSLEKRQRHINHFSQKGLNAEGWAELLRATI